MELQNFGYGEMCCSGIRRIKIAKISILSKLATDSMKPLIMKPMNDIFNKARKSNPKIQMETRIMKIILNKEN